MNGDIHADVTVAHGKRGFTCACSGEGVAPDGTITVRGNRPVRIHFRLSRGQGVSSVEFPDHRSGIWVGERGTPCPGAGGPSGKESPEFDDKQPGASGAGLSIRDRKSAGGDGRYPYVLAFNAILEDGAGASGFFDPMIANER